MVELGGADLTLKDRWEQTPLDEARRAGAQPVVEYLIERMPCELRVANAAYV
jgi:ankyrin repeat protein